MSPYPPSSPSIALFKEGQLVHFIERHHIEGRSSQMIADNLKDAFHPNRQKSICSKSTTSNRNPRSTAIFFMIIFYK